MILGLVLVSQSAFAYELASLPNLNLTDISCGQSQSFEGEVCIASAHVAADATHPAAYEEFIILKNTSDFTAYLIINPTTNTYRTSVPTTIRDINGKTSLISVGYYYQPGQYPGDGEYYPNSLKGRTPDGLTLDATLEISSRDH